MDDVTYSPLQLQHIVAPGPVASSPGPTRYSASVPILGPRKTSKPLKIVKKRESPKGLGTRIQDAVGKVLPWLDQASDTRSRNHHIMKGRRHKDRTGTRRAHREQPKQRNWFSKWTSMFHLTPREGPVSLRALACCAGAILVLAAITSLILMTRRIGMAARPAAAVLLIYLIMFGVGAMIVEMKNSVAFLENMRYWMEDWFPFLCVPLGKGCAYLFVAVLAGSLWDVALPVAIVGALFGFVGLLYGLVHLGLREQLGRIGMHLTAPAVQQVHYAHLDHERAQVQRAVASEQEVLYFDNSEDPPESYQYNSYHPAREHGGIPESNSGDVPYFPVPHKQQGWNLALPHNEQVPPRMIRPQADDTHHAFDTCTGTGSMIVDWNGRPRRV